MTAKQKKQTTRLLQNKCFCLNDSDWFLIWVSLSQEDPMPEGRQPRVVTPRPRSGASGQECQATMAQEQPRGATLRPRPGLAAKRPIPHPRSGATAERGHPAPEARRGGWEEPPRVQGAVAARAPEGLEKLFHIQGQERQHRGDTPRPR